MERSTSSSASRRHHNNSNSTNNPSFSSTLLDAIYRSFDDTSSAAAGGGGKNMKFYSEKEIAAAAARKGNYYSARNLGKEENGYETMKQKNKKQNQKSSGYGCEEEAEREKQRRLLLQNAAFREVRRKSGVEYSSSSSSDSSNGTGAGFSSSDDSFSIPVPRSQVLKPIRTSTTASSEARLRQEKSDVGGGGGGGFVKKKSRSLKNIYGDLKKVKQPISPGGRLASFLNSLFTAGTAKKAKMGGDRDEIRPSNSTSACSSASSFSRSCLSKTPSSRGGGGGKRSVRFYPVSVIVDEDSRPCGHKSVYGERREDAMAISTTRVVSAGINNPAAAVAVSEELKYRVMSESRRVEEVARELLKSYNQRKSAAAVEEELFSWRRRGDEVEMEVEEDDDVASCASSDLFELDNLSSIEGIERYREELPVYETTHLKTNRAIANSLVY
ncbi:unnamed protein product [Linum trigynum]|uniref:Protein BIG GRAIN 1-like B n=1 Tax=Linum trigynum TaxID=586398 RepID=A0AAV2DSM5_9ROSI